MCPVMAWARVGWGRVWCRAVVVCRSPRVGWRWPWRSRVRVVRAGVVRPTRATCSEGRRVRSRWCRWVWVRSRIRSRGGGGGVGAVVVWCRWPRSMSLTGGPFVWVGSSAGGTVVGG